MAFLKNVFSMSGIFKIFENIVHFAFKVLIDMPLSSRRYLEQICSIFSFNQIFLQPLLKSYF